MDTGVRKSHKPRRHDLPSVWIGGQSIEGRVGAVHLDVGESCYHPCHSTSHRAHLVCDAGVVILVAADAKPLELGI